MTDDTDWPKLAYRVGEAAKVMSVSSATIYRLIAAGKLKTVKIGGIRLVPARALRRLTEKGIS
jgi:excisionase family DNA binding protein